MGKKTILLLAHNDYTHSVGGVEKFITEQTEMFIRHGFDIIGLCPVIKYLKVKGRTVAGFFQGYRLIKGSTVIKELCTFEEIINTLKVGDLCKIVIHSLIRIPYKDVFRLIEMYSDVDTYYYIHDFKSICVCQVLMKNKNQYCGSEGRTLKKCHFCRFYWEGLSENRFYKNFISKYSHIIYVFPAEITRENWMRCYDYIEKNRTLVISHQLLAGEQNIHTLSKTKLRIAYVGYKSFNKGWTAFKELVLRDNGSHEFFVLGKTNEQLPNVQCVSVSFHEDGPNAMVNAIRKHNIDVALLWSTWPETYSYTLYESYVGGAFILTNPDSGNIQAQVSRWKCGKILSNVDALIDYVNGGDLEKDIIHNLQQRPSELIFNEKESLLLMK